MKLCKKCGKPMDPTKHRDYQKECWDCYGRDNNKVDAVPAGHVYIAEYFNMHTQETYEGMYKVGMTQRDNPQKRIAEIGDTLGPMKVRIVYHVATEDARLLESVLHEQLKLSNITGEWFAIDKIKLISILNETR